MPLSSEHVRVASCHIVFAHPLNSPRHILGFPFFVIMVHSSSSHVLYLPFPFTLEVGGWNK